MTRAVVCATGSVPSGKYADMLSLELEVQVIKEACANAGIRPRDLDGIVLCPPGYRQGFAPIRAQRVCERLGAWPRSAAEVEVGGLSSLYALRVAVAEVESGRLDVAVVAGAQAERSLSFTPEELDRLLTMNSTYGPWMGPYGVGPAVPHYAMSMQRYMHEHGVTVEEIAAVCVLLRKHAGPNPKAELREPITVEDVLSSRMVSPPLRFLMAAPWSDGACAVIVASAGWAASRGLPAVAVTGYGERHSPTSFLPYHEDLTSFSWIGDATREALSRANRSLDDVGVAEIYGAFAASELMTYEAMGFFAPGEAAKAVAAGRTTYGGDVVLNPSGGRISFGHPPPATPLYEAEEIWLQLTGRAGERQVPGARVGLVQGEHGMMNGAGVMILEG